MITTDYFQDGHGGGHPGYCNKIILAILKLHVATMPSITFWLIETYIWEQMWFEDYQDDHSSASSSMSD